MLTALVKSGFREREAKRALGEIPAEAFEDPEKLLRAALAVLVQPAARKGAPTRMDAKTARVRVTGESARAP